VSSRNFRRRNHRRRFRPGESPASSNIQSFPECPACGKPIRDLPSALSHRGSGAPAHFDCVLNELREANELAPQEKLCYLGGGCFGIIELKSSGAARFTIKKRIPYEDTQTAQEWKKQLLMS
jgi:hypothetical protein